MPSESLDSTLPRILDATKAEKVPWQAASTAETRYIANIEKWRFRIETLYGDGDAPFKFSLMQPGSGKGEIDALISSDPPEDDPSAEVAAKDEALRELWELASGKEAGTTEIDEVNSLLDSIL